jgi:hypothetical protein
MSVSITYTSSLVAPAEESDEYTLTYTIQREPRDGGIPFYLFVNKVDVRGPEHDTYSRVASIRDLSELRGTRVGDALHYRTNVAVIKDNLLNVEAAMAKIPILLQTLVDEYKTHKDTIDRLVADAEQTVTVTSTT